MPFLFLSPSTQDFNPYVTTGNEQYWMNQLADRMEPYLHASGVNVTRNDPDGSAAQSIRDSNASRQDFHLALHSNAGPSNLAGKLRGPDVYYYPYSASGKRAAELIADELRKIYPDPDLVSTVATTRLAEITKTSAPAVLVEIAYHDNAEDEAWIRNNITVIAEALTRAVCAYLEMNCAL